MYADGDNAVSGVLKVREGGGCLFVTELQCGKDSTGYDPGQRQALELVKPRKYFSPKPPIMNSASLISCFFTQWDPFQTSDL